MTDIAWSTPFEESRRIGSVVSVYPAEIVVNLTNAGSGETYWRFGEKIAAGELNEYVFVGDGETAVFGRLVKVWLEGADRLSVDEALRSKYQNHPLGLIQPLSSVCVQTGKLFKGIVSFPRLGMQVYASSRALTGFVISNYGADNNRAVELTLAHVSHQDSLIIKSTPEKLFARHCAVLGATGGGKSYTIAKMVEEVKRAGGKAILIDPTGEYADLDCVSYYFGDNEHAAPESTVGFPHYHLTDTDLRSFLRPSPQSQAPKLDSAIQSLRVLEVYKAHGFQGLTIDGGGCIKKVGCLKAPFENVMLTHSVAVKNSIWSFSLLADQVVNECVWPNGGTGQYPNPAIWGNCAESDVGHCLNLISRIRVYSESPHFRWMIDPPIDMLSANQLLEEIARDTSPGHIYRLDVSAIPFEANAREILVNALGRKLLTLARQGEVSRENPLIVFIDEAHQFLNKHVGEDSGRVSLDAFGNIAKEGRKYGLNVVIATQRPRDIPEDVLSQMGTLVVHRLTNSLDQDVVKKAAGDIDTRSVAFLPMLSQGEALLLGVDYPFPVIVQIIVPNEKPTSRGAEYSRSWMAERL